MKLTEFLPPTLLKVPLDSADKTGAITELVDLVAAQGLTANRDALLKPVELIALLASPINATSLHIQTLARLSRLVTNGSMLSRILAAKTRDELYAQIVASESEP
jgi:mannitol/fructose-specific phosphotransferase system IIA component (Ntr-type)